LSGIPTLNDIVAGNDEGLTPILKDTLSKRQDIPFMAIENEGSTEKINGIYCYVLRLYGRLINGQKALVTLKGIRVLFDILVPDGESPDECETKIRDILSGSVKTFSVEHTKAFPFRGYHTGKSHICKFIQTVLVVEKLLLKLFKIITTKLHQMIYTHFIVK